ncbi:MAG: nucleotidyl transferase AbiEii/AbiGii toxin family protein [Verrucomicrobia bacterium]|nr:nucleotidyl transferase AbiEii/AbiGii toxin family protein [Verrucomicrobiota bacterium]
MESVLQHLAQAQRRGELRFLVIGGRGLVAHGIQRFTKDLDLAIATSDLPALESILQGLGFATDAVMSQFVRFRHRDLAVPPIDVMRMSPATFERAWQSSRSFSGTEDGPRAPGLEVFVAMKLLAMRNQPDRRSKDLLDLEELLRSGTEPLTRASLQALCERFGVPGDFELLSRHLP